MDVLVGPLLLLLLLLLDCRCRNISQRNEYAGSATPHTCTDKTTMLLQSRL